MVVKVLKWVLWSEFAPPSCRQLLGYRYLVSKDISSLQTTEARKTKKDQRRNHENQWRDEHTKREPDLGTSGEIGCTREWNFHPWWRKRSLTTFSHETRESLEQVCGHATTTTCDHDNYHQSLNLYMRQSLLHWLTCTTTVIKMSVSPENGKT